MKSVEEQLSQYKSVHFNKKNIKTHFVGIPLIVWAVTVLLSLNTFEFTISGRSIHFTPAMVFFAIALLYYLKLHLKLALGMAAYVSINLYLASLIAQLELALYIALMTFIVGWLIQFIGHYFEKAKPAFIDDLSQFLIGPLFLMAEIYFTCGLEQKLNASITPLAIEKRRVIEKTKNT